MIFLLFSQIIVGGQKSVNEYFDDCAHKVGNNYSKWIDVYYRYIIFFITIIIQLDNVDQNYEYHYIPTTKTV